MWTLFCTTLFSIIIYFILVVKDTFLQIILSSGTVFMPPKWSLGYQQCRWSYISDQRVLEVLRATPTLSNSDEPGINNIYICTKLELEKLNITRVQSSGCCWLFLLSFFPLLFVWIREKDALLRSIWCAVCEYFNMQDVWGFLLWT